MTNAPLCPATWEFAAGTAETASPQSAPGDRMGIAFVAWVRKVGRPFTLEQARLPGSTKRLSSLLASKPDNLS